MKVQVSMTEAEIRRALGAYIKTEMGISIVLDHIEIQVKSKQNWKAEWEKANIKADFSAEVCTGRME